MIVCARLPYFSAAVLQREYRVAAAQPVVVTRRGKVTACCARAAEAGIRIGHSVRQAQARSMDASLVADDEECRRRAVDQVLTVLAEFTPLVAYQSERTKPKKRKLPGDIQQAAIFYLDLEALNQVDTVSLARQAGQVLRERTSFQSSFGIANSKFPASVAALYTDPAEPLNVLPGTEAEFLAPLPVYLLPIAEELHERLLRLGLTTIGSIARLPLSAALMQFGKQGYVLHRLAQGRDDRRVIPHQFAVVERVVRQFECALTSRTTLEAILRAVAIELSARLQVKGCMGRTLHLALYLENKTVRDSQVVLRQPVSGTLHLTRVLLQLFARTDSIRHGVVGLEVTLEDLVPFAGQQLDLFLHRTGQRERLNETLGNLTARYDSRYFLWITPADVQARRIEQRYRLQSVGDP